MVVDGVLKIVDLQLIVVVEDSGVLIESFGKYRILHSEKRIQMG